MAIFLVVALVTGCHSARSAGPSVVNRPAYTNAELQALALTSADMPTGYVATGDAGSNLGLCDRVVTDTEKAATHAGTVFGSPTLQSGLFEELYSFSSTSDGARLLQDFRSPGRACASSEVPMTRPAFGEEVATYALSLSVLSPGLKYDVGVVRSGSTVAILRFGVKHGSIDASTWQAILWDVEAMLLGT